MIQEYLAFGIFIGALVWTLAGIFRFVTGFKNRSSENCGGQCNCHAEKKNRLLPGLLPHKKNAYRHMKLK